MTPAERLLAVLPFGTWRPLRWLAHRAALSDNLARSAARQLIAAGQVKTNGNDGEREWHEARVLLCRVDGPWSQDPRGVGQIFGGNVPQPRAQPRAHDADQKTSFLASGEGVSRAG